MNYRDIFVGKRLERFMDRIGPVEPNGKCRLWTGDIGHQNRARAWLPDGTRVSAARVLWDVTYKDMPRPQDDIMHICHSPQCMEISCLQKGPRSLNMQMSARDGRMPRGPDKGALLSVTQVHLIRNRVKLGIYGDIARMARELGVPTYIVRDVVRRKTFDWLSEPEC